MPVISVSEARLHEALGKKYTENEFQDLCFNFGIELDEVTSPRKILEKQYKKKGKELTSEQKQKLKETSDEPVYKIEIAANRYDLLCEEGLFRALRIFTGKSQTPAFKTTPAQLEMHVKAETKQIREFVVCAVLRGVKFDQVRYDNFISLQDKLHQGVARKRTLVAIGTHDLDTIKAPFYYEAQKPEDIKFVALSQTEAKKADELLALYEEDPKFKHLKPYVPIIKGKERYPIIYDSDRNVLSLPPIINGDLSKITLDTKNVFIECTGTDRTKCYVVLNMMVTMFSEYCAEPFTVEQVKVVYPDSSVDITPNLGEIDFSCSLDYINRSIGCNISLKEAIDLLQKMQLTATEKDEKTLSVKVPPTRSDVLHPCDIMEDVAIAFGYNKIPRTTAKTATFGKQNPLNHFTDLLRLEMAMAGFTEILTFALCSNDDNFKSMNKVDDEKTAVKIDNAKTADFQTVRISLLPGLLKTLEQSISKGVPLQLFEISDVVLKDDNTDIGCRNSRKLAAAYCGHTGNLEFIHGTLDRLMEVLEINWNTADGYSIQQTEDSSFFPGRVAKVLLRGKQVGTFGLLHPTVLANFNITYPVSVLELDVEPFL